MARIEVLFSGAVLVLAGLYFGGHSLVAAIKGGDMVFYLFAAGFFDLFAAIGAFYLIWHRHHLLRGEGRANNGLAKTTAVAE